MAVGPNDVTILSVQTVRSDRDYRAGEPIQLQLEAEVGSALFDAGGGYCVGMTVIDETVPAQVFVTKDLGHYGDGLWMNPIQTFTYTVPGNSTLARGEHVLRLQAFVVGNARGPRDASHRAGPSLLITP